MHFFKYQSLGNDFIVFDGIKTLLPNLNKDLVKKLCKRNFGIGSDGILLLSNGPKATILNSDGSPGTMCLNGLRCLARHLKSKHNFPDQFKIEMAEKEINCSIQGNKILTTLETPTYIKNLTVNGFSGHVVEYPNPHFIIFQEITQKWLCENGHQLESHPSFPNKTNVEFVWNNYEALIYERGCGITLACGSGASAITSTLYHLSKISKQEKITINMPGGTLTSWINNNGKTVLEGEASLVFEGQYIDLID